MEFVQFHPTTLLGNNILITEGARGEGGVLLNRDGERFMARYAKEAMELAPRDIVARAIQTEINDGRGVGGDHVDLLLAHLGKDRIKRGLPGIRQIAMDFAGIDPVTAPIPVEPGQHYSMGGVAVSNDCRSSVKGLLSAGEAACVSVHGANRLGGNSLLETVVFGRIAGASASADARRAAKDNGGIERAMREEQAKIQALIGRRGSDSVADIRATLKRVMNDRFQLFRNAGDMRTGLEMIHALRKRFESASVLNSSHDFNYGLTNYLELENMLQVAETVAAGALAREESRGSHFRTDFPKRDDARFLKHTIVRRIDGRLELTYKPVRLGKFEVKERTY